MLLEECRVLRAAAIPPRIVGATHAPKGLVTLIGPVSEVGEHVTIVALELAHPWKAPATVSLWIRRVPRLSCWAASDSDLVNYVACMRNASFSGRVRCGQ
jgi:hypothetical protein